MRGLTTSSTTRCLPIGTARGTSSTGSRTSTSATRRLLSNIRVSAAAAATTTKTSAQYGSSSSSQAFVSTTANTAAIAASASSSTTAVAPLFRVSRASSSRTRVSNVVAVTPLASSSSRSRRRFMEAIMAGMMAAVLTSTSLYFVMPQYKTSRTSSYHTSCQAILVHDDEDDEEEQDHEEEQKQVDNSTITRAPPYVRYPLQRQPCQKRTTSFIQATSATTTADSFTDSSAATATMTATSARTQHHNVSFRPRWFNNNNNNNNSSTSSTSSSSSSTNENSRGSNNEHKDWMAWIQNTGKPYEVSIRAIRGGRFTMEDEYFVANGGRFAAIFDGHGGSGVSQYLKRQLYPNVSQFLQQYYWEECDVQEDPELLIPPPQPQPPSTSSTDSLGEEPVLSSSSSSPQQLSTRPSRPRVKPSLSCHVSALRAAFEKVEQDVMNDDNLEFQGSTAVAVVVVESEDGHRTLLSANVGDSRAVLSRKGRAVELTHDHKPNDEKEKARIMAMGETIEWDQDCKVHRVRNLSLARAIGDRYAKPAVSPEVEIQHFPVVEDQDEFVVIASDGLWDVMSSQEAVTYVHSQMQRELASLSAASSKDNMENYRVVLRRNMAKFLAREAIRKGSSDNVSVLMVWLC